MMPPKERVRILREAKPLLVLALFLLMGMGCAAIGPVSSPEFPNLVKTAIPGDEGNVRLFAPGNWYPNAVGFTDVRSIFLYATIQSIPGVCVITETSLLFLQWHDPEGRLEVVKRIPHLNMLSVALDSYGLSRRMVVRKKDFSFESFDFSSDSGTMIDAEKVETATALLQDQLGVNDPQSRKR